MRLPLDFAASVTVPASFAVSAIQHAVKQGYNGHRLLHSSGIDPEIVGISQARLPAASYVNLLSTTIRVMKDEFLGYADQPVNIGTWQLACLSSVHPGTVGHAIARICRYYRVLDHGIRPHLVAEGDDAMIELVSRDGQRVWDMYFYERCLGGLRCFIAWLLHDALTVRQVAFPQDRSAHPDEYRWMFPRSEMIYNQPRAALRFDRSILNLPMRRSERELDQMLIDPHRELVTACGCDGTWTTRIKELISRELPWVPEFEDVAMRLSIHPQALRRRLSQEGVSFNEVKDQIRFSVADFYLSRHFASVEEVAFRAGFSEASSFIRAFRRWTGTTPTAFAEAHGAAPRRRCDTRSEAQRDTERSPAR